MTKRSLGAALGLGLALLSGPAPAAPNAPPRATTVPRAIVASGDLYSARARRLVRAYLQLRLLELRNAELDRVRAVIEGKLGVDALFSPPPRQASDRAPGR